MSFLADDVRVVDCDSHMTEAHDLWLKRAPDAYRDRVPRVELVDGQPSWVVDGTVIGAARGGGVINKRGEKAPMIESMRVWGIDEVHPAAYDLDERLKLMDEFGIYAQVTYPNTIGIGGTAIAAVLKDQALQRLCVEIYNDELAEIQERSGNRVLPMALLPMWDVDSAVSEAQRVARLGLRGVNLTSDPQDIGGPDLANRAWTPLWEVCESLRLPVHFHIASSLTAMNFFGNYFWPSQHEGAKVSIGATMLFIGNARVVVNTILCGIFDRHPALQMVSVESGCGWIPFIMEAMDYEFLENAPAQAAELAKLPSEYFRDNWYATYWFEQNQGNLQSLFDAVGDDNILFETDFPHPTCLYPRPLEMIANAMETVSPASRRKVLGDNAVKLYRL